MHTYIPNRHDGSLGRRCASLKPGYNMIQVTIAESGGALRLSNLLFAHDIVDILVIVNTVNMLRLFIARQ